MSPKENKKMTIKNILAIGVFIVLLGIGIWSAVQVIRFVPRLFSGTGVNPTQIITGTKSPTAKEVSITTSISDHIIDSGSKLAVTWPSIAGTDGVISFSYKCIDGVSFKTNEEVIPCNEPHTLARNSTSLTIVPISTKKTAVTSFAITYTDKEGNSTRSTQTITIKNTSVRFSIGTRGPVEPLSVVPTSIQTYQNVQPVLHTIRVAQPSNPLGMPDLKVTMIGVGEITSYGAFAQTNVIRGYFRGAAKFRVTNSGTKETGVWMFSAVVPSRGAYPFTSRMQQSLMPGSSADVLVTFDQLIPGTHSFNVQVDPYNYIHELNEYNNTTGQTITVIGY